MDSIIIRNLAGSDEFRQIERVQTVAWGRDKRSLVPWEFMKTARYSGGIAVGAFDQNQLIGYAFGILGAIPYQDERANLPPAERLQLYSHQLGVLPDYQSMGIGRRLKLAQRERCRRRGINLMTWTFDPLMGRNGWLNLGHLGGMTGTFLPDWYGPLRHRCLLEWWIDSRYVQERLDQTRPITLLDGYLSREVPIANPTTTAENGLVIPPTHFDVLDHEQILLEIPGNIKAVGQQNPALEKSWRIHAKAIFSAYFSRGYIFSDVTRTTTASGHRVFYVMTKQNKTQRFEPPRVIVTG